MAKEISVENVCQFITDHGGKIKNTILVSNFKKVLNDPATKDEARQKFKECVNIVAVVKTENGEKYVQLKKKYRNLSTHSGSSVADGSLNVSNVSQDSSSGHDTSFNPATDVPYADGGKHEKSKHSRSPSQEKLKHQSSPRHQSSHQEEKSPKEPLEHRSPSKSHRKSESNHAEDHAQKAALSAQDTTKEKQDHREKEKSSKEVSEHRSPSKSHSNYPRRSESGQEGQDKEAVPSVQDTTKKQQEQAEKENLSKPKKEESSLNIKAASTPASKSGPDANFAVPASVPMRKKKDRKENVPPSPKPDHIPRVASVDRLKSNLLNSSDQRPPRSRPISVAQGSYVGSVERARQNFLNKQKPNDDSTSLALSERSLDSKGDEQDDEYDRNLPSVALDMNEKEWIIRSAQGNLVEMRKLLNNDSTLADKRDFIMSALHWAAKKGNTDMVNMLIDQKVNINCRSGYTPLHIAAMHGHEEIITLLLDAGCDSNVRDYSGHQPIYYLKSVSLPLQSKSRYEPNTPSWKHHYHAGTKHKPTVRTEVYRRLERSMRGRRITKVPSESRRSITGDDEIAEGRPRVNSAGSSERKNSAGNIASKGGKVSRAESMLKGIGIRKKASFRKSKHSGSIAEEPVKIEHQVPLPAPSNKPPPSSGFMWKPVGPKV